MRKRTKPQLHNSLAEPKVPVMQAQVHAVFRSVVEPYLGCETEVMLVTGIQGQQPTTVVGQIETMTDSGFVLRVLVPTESWTTFVAWADLWTGHTRFVSDPLRTAVDEARGWLCTHTAAVIELDEARARYGLVAIV